jgi:hypothetical protein
MNLHRKVNQAPGMDAVTATIICHVDDRVVVTLDKASKNPPGNGPKGDSQNSYRHMNDYR